MARPEIVRAETAKSEIRATVSLALATALVTGFDEASEDGHPLTEVQKISVAKMSVMAYSHALEGCENIDLSVKLERSANATTDPRD